MRMKRDAVELFMDAGIYVPTRTIELIHEPDAIDRATAARFIKGFHVLSHISKDPITILLCSVGGCITSGLAIHDYIRAARDIEVTIAVVGEACSIASLILQAGDRRVMYPHAELMLHSGANDIEGVAKDIERIAAADKKRRETLYKIYADRTGKKAAYFRRKLANDWFLSPTEALAENLIDEVIDL